MNENEQAILMIVRQIPKGKVATYGQIARLAGIPKNARQVGSVLRRLESNSGIPWHRVVNAKGEISVRKAGEYTDYQHELLVSEGVVFRSPNRISLADFGWAP